MEKPREKNPNNIRKGIRARSEGLAFETLLANTARRAGIRVIPIPQGCKKVRRRRGHGLVLVKTPFDMIFSVTGRSAFIDSKSISGDTLVYSFLTPHQVDIMSDLEIDGHKAGYIVHFKETNRVIFYSATKLQELRSRESYSQDDGEDLGKLFEMNLKEFLCPA